jgi:hypothetical protein
VSWDRALLMLGGALLGAGLALLFAEGLYGFTELKYVARVLSPVGTLLIGFGQTLQYRRREAANG